MTSKKSAFMGPCKRFPNIAKAALEISYDNGGINRGRTEAKMLRELGRYLDGSQYRDCLLDIDRFLGKLTDDELVAICTAEESERQELIVLGPPFTDALLNEIFEKVG